MQEVARVCERDVGPGALARLGSPWDGFDGTGAAVLDRVRVGARTDHRGLCMNY
jgi:hypothetical protein